MQRELERQLFIPPTLPMEQCQKLHLSDVGLACHVTAYAIWTLFRVRKISAMQQIFRYSRSRWQQAEQGAPGPLLPSNVFQFLLGDPEAFPGQLGYVIPPVSSGSPTCWTCPENIQGEAPRRHPDQMPEPPQLAPFETKEQLLSSPLLTLSLRLSPATLRRKLILAIWDLIGCIRDLVLSVTTQCSWP